MDDKKVVWIPGNVPSSKNSKIWTGKYLVHSKTTRRYIKDTEWIYKTQKEIFKSHVEGVHTPYSIAFRFVRNSRRKFDYINAAQVVQDLMVKNEWIEDDNCDFLIPHFHPHEYNKMFPGVEIQVLGSKHAKIP